MEKVTTGGRIVNVPTDLEELEPKQYKYLLFLSSQLAAGNIDLEFYRLRLFSFLLGFDGVNYTILKADRIAEIERQLPKLNDFLKPSRTADGPVLRVDIETTRNLLPEYHRYKGPGDWLNGVTFGEFVECITDIETLAEIARTSGGDIDPEALRESYNHIARVLYHIPSEDRVPDILAYHAPTLFATVWRAIQSGPIEINGRNIDFSIIFKGTGNGKPDDKTGWTGITFEVASANVFGNVADVEAADLWAVLLYLYKCKFEYNHDKNNTK